ncbi:echinoderm microtubule-associated protein-like 1 [Elysia marginata]|uniref:Echinoderm microtubule-associated protein-like 1 n=1 Tax=Elysia marginata TaxID=1093978 RepID=A0AAV4FXL4_9GAST|nr:echinoderm microtubule-associated protein-like 1 [Elysia marginata]
MEKAQANAYDKHPELPDLIEKKKENKSSRIVTPEPFDELSSSTRSKVMSKLLKKASSRRSPVPPQRTEEEKEKETKKSETKHDSNASLKKTVEPPTAMTLSSNRPAEEGDRTKSHTEETKAANQNQDSDHVTKVLPNGAKVAIPRGYQSPVMTSDPPKERLQLEWIYGYRGHGQASGSRPQMLASGEIAYFIACTVVLYDREEHRQRHYRQHTASIRCLAVHSAGVIVASGQDCLHAAVGRSDTQAHIRVWRSDTMATLHVIGAGVFQNSVIALSFMPGLDVLATCDNSQNKQLTIWNTADGDLVAKTFISTDVVTQLTFNLRYPETLVTCGKEHLAWWKIYLQTKMIQPLAKPNYEGFLKARYINCARHNQRGDLITGDSNGTVYVWGDGENRITNFVKHGHEGPVLDVLQYKGYLLTAGRDGAVACWTWDRNMDNEGIFKLPESEGGVRSLLMTPPTETSEAGLVLGTTMNSLLGVDLNPTDSPLTGASFDGVPITQGHAGELRAVARIRKSFLGADIVTASGEGTVSKFTSGRKEPVWKLWLKGNSFSCVDCSECGDVLALGTKEGHVLILEIDRSSLAVMELYHRKLTPGMLTALRFSPDESMLAAGTSDRCIHILHLKDREHEEDKRKLESEKEWAYYGILRGHTGQIHSLDWSADRHGDVIRSSTTSPEQKFWDVSRCEEISGENLSDFPWSSATCLLDHKTAGRELNTA